tara:strand:+ start:6749 stop:7288 length:540 start_codon:yes stop_codon:yes gene_type:complete
MKNLRFYDIQFYFLFISIIFISSCASNLVKISQGEITYSKAFHFKLSKDDLYKYSLNWVNSKFKGIQKLEFNNNLIGPNSTGETNLRSNMLINTIISEGLYKIPGLLKIEIRYTCKIQCKENKAIITFSDFHYYVDNNMQRISWEDFNRKIKKKLISQFDNYFSDFSRSASYEKQKFDW